MSARRARFVFAAIASCAAVAIAAPSRIAGQASPATGSIFGQVIDAATGQPVPGALVVLDDARPNPGPTPVDEYAPMPNGAIPPKRAIGNGAGQFVFHDLPKSRYRVQAGAPGYMDGTYGQAQASSPGRLVELDEGAHLANANVRLWRYATVSGRVVDDAGEPAVGFSVQALKVAIEGTSRRFVGAGRGTTDDRGVYRIERLAPASYVVGLPQTITTMPAASMEAMTSGMLTNSKLGSDLMRELEMSGGPYPYAHLFRGVRAGDLEVEMTDTRSVPIAPASTPGAILAYRSVFFPGTFSAADAEVLTLTSAQDRSGVDLQLKPAPAVKVSGTVTGPNGPARGLGVHLTGVNARGDLETYETADGATDDAGAFTLLGVPSGQYVLRAYRAQPGLKIPDGKPPAEKPLFSQRPLTIGDRDVQGIALTLREGATVSGRVEFRGTSTPPAAVLDQIRLQLVDRSSSRFAPSWPVRVGADGTFVTVGSPPGSYSIEPDETPTWTFLSATLNGRDLDDAPLTLDTSDVSGVIVTYTSQPTRVSGIVHAQAGPRLQEGDAMVLAFPANAAAWFEHGMPRRYLRTVPPDKNGAFSVTGLPPGEYIFCAIPSELVGESMSSAFFDAVSRAGSRVTLATGQATSVDLVMRPIR